MGDRPVPPVDPSYSDPEVLAEFVAAARPEPRVAAVQLVAGDPDARLAGPELTVLLPLDDGLDQDELGCGRGQDASSDGPPARSSPSVSTHWRAAGGQGQLTGARRGSTAISRLA